jgi:hypothetical protein
MSAKANSAIAVIGIDIGKNSRRQVGQPCFRLSARPLLPKHDRAALVLTNHVKWSTGPRTPQGLERSRRANWKHGHFSREAKAERSRLRAAILALRGVNEHAP